MVKTLERHRYALCEKHVIVPFCCSYQVYRYLAGCFGLISCRHYLVYETVRYSCIGACRCVQARQALTAPPPARSVPHCLTGGSNVTEAGTLADARSRAVSCLRDALSQGAAPPGWEISWCSILCMSKCTRARRQLSPRRACAQRYITRLRNRLMQYPGCEQLHSSAP